MVPAPRRALPVRSGPPVGGQPTGRPYAVCVGGKSKVPRPPRTGQAPAQRSGGSSRNGLPRAAWVAGGVVALGAIAVVVSVLTFGGGTPAASSEASVAAALRAANCSYRTVKPLPPRKDPGGAMGGYHEDVPTLATPTKGLWSTFPPSAGAHFDTWAVWGFYRQAVNPREVVHNEEHGGVVIWWGPGVPDATVDELEAFYQQEMTGVFCW